nr:MULTISPECIES: hypothetical protein [unclassified Pseudoxanthomonas]
MIEAAATKIMIPSSAAEKYSTLLWPKWWSSSAGRAAMVSETRATMAATRLTIDSAASDSRPTEPVIAQALPLSSTVSTAVTMASQAYFLRSGVASAGLPWGFMETIVRCDRGRGQPRMSRSRQVRSEPRPPAAGVVLPARVGTACAPVDPKRSAHRLAGIRSTR